MIQLRVSIRTGTKVLNPITQEIERVVDGVRIVQDLRKNLSPHYTIRATLHILSENGRN